MTLSDYERRVLAEIQSEFETQRSLRFRIRRMGSLLLPCLMLAGTGAAVIACVVAGLGRGIATTVLAALIGAGVGAGFVGLYRQWRWAPTTARMRRLRTRRSTH